MDQDWDFQSSYPKTLSEVIDQKEMTKREEILEKVKSIVCTGERYGKPENSFKQIALLWSDYLGTKIDAKDVCCLMILLKLVRIKNNPEHLDSCVDVAGYGICCAESIENDEINS